MHKWILGPLIAAVVGLYGIILKHILHHVRVDGIERNASDVATLKNSVQFKDNCREIVLRQDGRHEEVCKKLDNLDDQQQKTNQTLHQILGELRAKKNDP
ncbi:MAG: hypothetical protein JXM79_11070 [Sedimentisphaerales bacterium]|nr:hypothetical protein [Sedimentisphaerales bacterium]